MVLVAEHELQRVLTGLELQRHLGLAGTDMANATAGSIRSRLLKLGAVVTRSVRRIGPAFATGCPAKAVFTTAVERLCAMRGAGPPVDLAA